MSTTHSGTRVHCRGFTLLEVLVAVLVTSIGLLGVAKLVMSAVRANNSAFMRSQAVDLTYAILDSMRANRASAMTNGYDAPPGPYANPGLNCNSGATCTPAQLASFDLYQWKQRLGAALPAGDGSVVTARGVNGLVTATITVQWDDSLAQWAYGTPAAVTTPPARPVTLVTVL